jgi:hypothetical protein
VDIIKFKRDSRFVTMAKDGLQETFEGQVDKGIMPRPGLEPGTRGFSESRESLSREFTLFASGKLVY